VSSLCDLFRQYRAPCLLVLIWSVDGLQSVAGNDSELARYLRIAGELASYLRIEERELDAGGLN
jgi:hypothetical protein